MQPSTNNINTLTISTGHNLDELTPEKSTPTCCCGVFRTNVEQGALIIACLGILFSFLGALIFFAPGSNFRDVWMGIAALFYLVPCVCVVLALRRRDPRFYLPYLIYGLFELLFYTSEMFVSILFALNPPEDNVQQFLKEHPHIDHARSGYQLSQYSEAAVLLFDVAVSLWFYSVIFKAFKLMRHQRSAQGRMRLDEVSIC